MRQPVNRSKSKNAFNDRHSKTHKVNLSAPRRGGIRL